MQVMKLYDLPLPLEMREHLNFLILDKINFKGSVTYVPNSSWAYGVINTWVCEGRVKNTPEYLLCDNARDRAMLHLLYKSKYETNHQEITHIMLDLWKQATKGLSIAEKVLLGWPNDYLGDL